MTLIARAIAAAQDLEQLRETALAPVAMLLRELAERIEGHDAEAEPSDYIQLCARCPFTPRRRP